MADYSASKSLSMPMQVEAARPISPLADDVKPLSQAVVSGVVGLGDGLAVFAAGLGSLIASDAGPHIDRPFAEIFVALAALMHIRLMYLAGGFRFAVLRRLGKATGMAAAGWAATALVLAAILYLTGTFGDASGRWLLTWFAGTLAALAIGRAALALQIRRWDAAGRLCRSIAVVGAGPLGQKLLQRLNEADDPAIRIVGVYDDRRHRLPDRCAGHPIRGSVDNLINDIRRYRVDSVIVALPLAADGRIAEILEKLSLVTVDTHLCPDEYGLRMGARRASHVGGITVLDAVDRPMRDWSAFAKAVEDRVLASLILVLIAPLMLLLALAIKLDSRGPVFFRQKRHGFNNELIEVLKFRTMYHHARDPNAEQLTCRNDPRVTRIGGFLRRTSLDELPQFINVLRGEMSVVGPRPHAVSAKAGGLLYRDAVRNYESRHRMKPGITGWAQVNGWRGETETVEQIRKRVEHDLYYIENWSVALDLIIVFRTILGGFTGRHAY